MQRGWSSFADTGEILGSSVMRVLIWTRSCGGCVGGDVHPVGVRRHLNDPRICVALLGGCLICSREPLVL